MSHFAQNTSGRVFQGWEYSFLEMDGKQRLFMKVESFGTSCPVPRCSSCWTRTNRWTLTPWRHLLRRTIGAEIRSQWGRHIFLDPRRYLQSLLSPTNWPTATITRAHKSCWEEQDCALNVNPRFSASSATRTWWRSRSLATQWEAQKQVTRFRFHCHDLKHQIMILIWKSHGFNFQSIGLRTILNFYRKALLLPVYLPVNCRPGKYMQF